jgi:predicted metalloprotease
MQHIATSRIALMLTLLMTVLTWNYLEPVAHAQIDIKYRRLRMAGAGLTERDMEVLHAKINMAIPYLQQVWKQIFAGTRSANRPPVFQDYSVAFQTPGCGEIPENNAFWCSAEHTIYYDEVFLGQLMRWASVKVGGDGDYAPIVVLAHETGHAVADKMGVTRQISLYEETSADCMAGVVTYLAQRDGHLDKDDIHEANYALSLAPDSGDLTYAQELATPGAHGSAGQRQLAFEVGLYSGNVKLCMKDWPRDR